MRGSSASLLRALPRAAAAALALLAPAAAQEGSGDATAPSLTFYPALHLKFVDGQARNYFHSRTTVVNVSGQVMHDLVMKQEFPEGFTPQILDPRQVADLKRPEGFGESLEGGTYTMTLPELRIAEATSLAVALPYRGRPTMVRFPGAEVTYSQGGERKTLRGPDQTWDLGKYTRYSGTMQDFIKRFAGLEMRVPSFEEDWGFSSLAHRSAGKVSTGVVEIDEEPGGRLSFSIESGAPGSLRQMMVRRRPRNPAREPKAKDEVRRFVLDLVQASADFTLDSDAISIAQRKVGRFDAWVADTRWRDRIKDRLGEGPSRWYVFVDDKSSTQYIINVAAQGRGAGPGKADAPNPAREEELMSTLETMVSSLRLL